MGRKKKGSNSQRGQGQAGASNKSPQQAAAATQKTPEPEPAVATTAASTETMSSPPVQKLAVVLDTPPTSPDSPPTSQPNATAATPTSEQQVETPQGATQTKSEQPKKSEQSKKEQSKKSDQPKKEQPKKSDQPKKDQPKKSEQPKKSKSDATAVAQASAPTPAPAATQGATEGADGEKTKAQLKAERKAQFEAERKAKMEAEQKSGEQPAKTKAELKAERRAIQEAQRQAKEEEAKAAGDKGKAKDKPKEQAKKSQGDQQQTASRPTVPPTTERRISERQTAEQTRKKRKRPRFDANGELLKLGVQLRLGVLIGASSESVSMLATLRNLIVMESEAGVVYRGDERIVPDAGHNESPRELDARVKKYISYIADCRALSVGMGNSIKHLKNFITHDLPQDIYGADARRRVSIHIKHFINEKIFLAMTAVVSYTAKHYVDGNIIAVNGSSYLIKTILEKAHELGMKFAVMVVDNRANFTDLPVVQSMKKLGVHLIFSTFTSLQKSIQRVDEVLIEGQYMQNDGSLVGVCGNTILAHAAHMLDIPVIACCESYKFTERCSIDTIPSTPLSYADPKELVTVANGKDGCLLGYEETESNLELVNLRYELTPNKLLSCLISEGGGYPAAGINHIKEQTHTKNKKKVHHLLPSCKNTSGYLLPPPNNNKQTKLHKSFF